MMIAVDTDVNTKPHFDWVTEADHRNCWQQSHRDIYDSGTKQACFISPVSNNNERWLIYTGGWVIPVTSKPKPSLEEWKPDCSKCYCIQKQIETVWIHSLMGFQYLGCYTFWFLLSMNYIFRKAKMNFKKKSILDKCFDRNRRHTKIWMFLMNNKVWTISTLLNHLGK